MRERTCSEVRINIGILQDTFAGRDHIGKIFIHKKLLKFNELSLFFAASKIRSKVFLDFISSVAYIAELNYSEESIM
jgi:hypothetical protein